MNFKADKQRLYELLSQESRCFVHICDTDDALWVSDLPRKREDLSDTEKLLWQNGFVGWINVKTRLLYVDWTEASWKKILSTFSPILPAFPQDDRYHAAYALCRLWLSHPSSLTPDTLPAVRRLLKLRQQPEEAMLKAIAPLHEQAAVQLRTGRLVAHAAGWILSDWLNERSSNA